MRNVEVTKAAALVVLLALLALCGCGHVKSPAIITEGNPVATAPASVVLHGDVDFTADEQSKVLLAAELWRVQTGGLADIQVVFDARLTDPAWSCNGCSLLGRFTSEDKLVQEADEASEGQLLGRVSPSGGIHNPWKRPVLMLLVADRLHDGDRWMAATVHEMGHVLGLPHVSSPQSVMFPIYIRHAHACLKRHDLVTFCQVNDCGHTEMHPCE